MKIAKAIEYSLSTLFKELRNTKVTCANCTAIITAGRKKDV